MGRPPAVWMSTWTGKSGLKATRRVACQLDVFCLQEGVSRSTFYRWIDQLRRMASRSRWSLKKWRRKQAETGEAVFLPVSLKASPVEIELPNGGCGATAPGRRSGGAGGSHPSCGVRCVPGRRRTHDTFSDVRIFLCTTPTKMSYSFDSLMGQAQKIFDQDPTSGHLFLFLNRDRDRHQDLVLGSGWVLHLVQAAGGGHVSTPRGCRRTSKASNWTIAN